MLQREVALGLDRESIAHCAETAGYERGEHRLERDGGGACADPGAIPGIQRGSTVHRPRRRSFRSIMPISA